MPSAKLYGRRWHFSTGERRRRRQRAGTLRRRALAILEHCQAFRRRLCTPQPSLPIADIVAIPAGLSGLFHAAWIIILLVWAGATGGWPGHCTSHEGAQYAALFGAFLLTSALNLVIDVLLVRHSLQGAPFEASKRRWVVPLLYASTAPLVLQLGLAGVQGVGVCRVQVPGSWVVV